MRTIRPARAGEAAALAGVFFYAVRDGAAPDAGDAGSGYSEAERRAWAPSQPTPEDWDRRMDGLTTFVAERDGAPVGFFSVRADGYLDLAFVLPGEQRQGTGAALYDHMLDWARVQGLGHLTTQASLRLHPFLIRRGWCVLKAQEVTRRGVALRNFVMELDLTADR